MAKRDNQHIYSPAFNELAYRTLLRITPEQKETLTIAERTILADKYSLQKFCKVERLDRVLALMAKVGISWTFRVEKEAFEADMVEFISHNQYQYPQKRVDAAEATAREGICVISSREVMMLSHIVAQNCTTKVYEISEFDQNLIEAGGKFTKLKGWDNAVSSAGEARDMFNMVQLELLNSFDYAEKTFGLNQNELRILCALYEKKHGAIRMKDMAQLTKAQGKKMYFRADMQRLLNRDFVTSDQKDAAKMWANSSYFMITTKGIDKIMRYQEFVFNNAFNKK